MMDTILVNIYSYEEYFNCNISHIVFEWMLHVETWERNR